MTNREKLIDSLSNRKLAEILQGYCLKTRNCKQCLFYNSGLCFHCSIKYTEQWLESEVEE